jgi:DNA sulfur modification protein DndD
MLLRRIQLENFKIFYGKNVLDFLEGDNNVVLIQGDNGHGKTTIMESIFWALYGKEKKHDKLLNPTFTKMINNLAQEKGENLCSVTLNFDHDGKHYLLQRTVSTKRKTPSKNSDYTEEVKLRINGRDEPDIDQVITEIFPEDIATFFFFDGETISRFAETYTDNKETIEKALGLPYLKRAREDAEKIKKDVDRNLRDVKISPNIEKLEKEVENQDKKREDKAKMLGITEKILANLNTERDKLQGTLDEFEELKAIQDRINDLEEFSQELDKEEETHKDSEWKFVTAIPSLIIRGTLKKSVEDIGAVKEQSITDRINQGRIMDQKEFLEHLITTGYCLCGSEFTQDSLERLKSMVDALKEQLEQIHPVPTDRFAWTQGDITDAMFRVKNLEAEMVNLPKLEAKRDYIDDNHKRISKALAHEHENLSAHSSANAREKEVFDRLNKLTQDRAVYMSKRDELKDEHEAIERSQLDTENQLRKELEMQNQDTLKLSRQIDLIDRVLNTFSDIIERSAENKRRKIEEKGSKIFHEITNKPQEFIGLDIDKETFEVQVRGSQGETINTKRLSDGEKHVVALSFLGGIKESTSEGSLIMDSPFGRLDQTHKSRLINRISDLGQQVVLLVTDEDLNKSEIENMKCVQSRYMLEHDQEKKVSRIVPIAGAALSKEATNPSEIMNDPHLEHLMTMMMPENDEGKNDGGPVPPPTYDPDRKGGA